MSNQFNLSQIHFSGSVNISQSRFYNVPDPIDGTEIVSRNFIDSYVVTTGSNNFIGDQHIDGNVFITGNTTTAQLIVSSSVYHVTHSSYSGSTISGDDLIDTHQFTGSVLVTGSMYLNGTPIGTGKLDETTFNIYTSSNDTRLDTDEVSIDSLNANSSSYLNTSIFTTYTSSNDTRLDNDEVSINSLNVASSSYLLNTTDNFNGILDITGSLSLTGSFTSLGGIRLKINPYVAITTASINDYFILSNIETSEHNIALPFTPTNGQTFMIKKISSGSYKTIINGNGNLIDNEQYDYLYYQYDQKGYIYNSNNGWNIF